MRNVLVSFWVPGQPVPDARPRFVRATGRTYTAERVVAWRRHVRECAHRAMLASGMQPLPPGTPTALTVVACFVRPKYHYVGRDPAKGLRADAPTLHTSAPDRDNIEKLVLDALGTSKRPLLWADDGASCAGRTVKIFEDENGPGLFVVVYSINMEKLIDERAMSVEERLDVLRLRMDMKWKEFYEFFGLHGRGRRDPDFVVPRILELGAHEQCYVRRIRSGLSREQLVEHVPMTVRQVRNAELGKDKPSLRKLSAFFASGAL